MDGVVAHGVDLSKTTTVVCDLDGVVYVGAEPVPGAGPALLQIDRAGIDLLFATNNSTKTPADTAAAIADRAGYTARADQVITSGLATAQWMGDDVSSALVVGEQGLVDTIRDAGIEVVGMHDHPEAVVVGLDRDFDYDKLAAAARAVRRGAALYATNIDPTLPTPEGLDPGCGAIVAAVERASGIEAVVCGKPYPPMESLIADRAAGAEIVVVGDRPDTDLAVGRKAGWSSILVLTGVTSGAEEVPAELSPTAVVASLADVPPLLGVGRDGRGRHR